METREALPSKARGQIKVTGDKITSSGDKFVPLLPGHEGQGTKCREPAWLLAPCIPVPLPLQDIVRERGTNEGTNFVPCDIKGTNKETCKALPSKARGQNLQFVPFTCYY